MSTRLVEGNLIAHAGGSIEGTRYTNSLEAISFSSEHTKILELDVVMSKDGIIVAHDGLEKNYGLKSDFCEVNTKDFLSTKYSGKFTTLSFEDLAKYASTHEVKCIIDVKEQGNAYDTVIEFIDEICQKYLVFDKFIIQVYTPRDYDKVATYPFYGVFVVMWKNYGNLFATRSYDYIEHCLSDKRIAVKGISIYYLNRQSKTPNIDFPEFQNYLSNDVDIYVHGHKKGDELSILERGFGIFTHYVSEY